jgi:4-carboxymuconolactone decarboxylase
MMSHGVGNRLAEETIMSDLPQPYQQFKQEHSRVWDAYDQLGAAAADAGPLEQKVRELIKLGMAAAVRSESAVHSHVHRALEVGASAAEIEHTILLGVTTLGFPTMMAARTWARAAIEAHNS